MVICLVESRRTPAQRRRIMSYSVLCFREWVVLIVSLGETPGSVSGMSSNWSHHVNQRITGVMVRMRRHSSAFFND